MIVVIIRDHHDIDGRHLSKRYGHRLKTFRPDECRRRSARPPHRIGQNAYAVDLDQHRGVSEPRDSQTALRFLGPRVERTYRRQWPPWHSPLAAAHKIFKGWHGHSRI